MKKALLLLFCLFLTAITHLQGQSQPLGLGLKTELYWPFRAILNPGLIPLHLEAELSDPKHRFAVSGIVRYFHYDGEGDLQITPGLPPIGQIIRSEITLGLGVRCYPAILISEKTVNNFSFFVEPQLHYRIFQDSLVYLPWNYHSSSESTSIKAAIKIGYQKVFFSCLIVEPAVVLGYFPDFKYYSRAPFATLNLMVGYGFNRLHNRN
jgi:hypothetical protein